MSGKRFFWYLLRSYLLLVAAALALITLYASRSVRAFHEDQVRGDLEARARLLAEQIEPLLVAGDTAGIQARCRRAGRQAGNRYTVIARDGSVLGDSNEDPAAMENHGDRPEIVEAFQARVGASVRRSATLKRNMMYVALPLHAGPEVVAVVRSSMALTRIDEAHRSIVGRLVVAGLIIALATALVSLTVSRRFAHPIELMRRAAGEFAHGNFTTRVPAPDARELAQLADAMNWMATQLDEKIATIREQEHGEQVVLSNMIEGVLTVDQGEQVLSMNRAAADLLDADVEHAAGRPFVEVIRNADLNRFVRDTLASPGRTERDIAIYTGDGERYLQAHGTNLRNAAGHLVGALVVLNDVTRLRRLERVRRDFVANVSHELKTPITSIKGFLETLLDGAADDPGNARRFMGLAAKNADRLAMIIDDLLSLARLEQETERGRITLDDEPVARVIDSAVETCRHIAEEKGVALRCAVEEGLSAPLNHLLLEQAVVNLIDNAIKYSDAGGEVTVETRGDGGEAVIEVSDQGVGIPDAHLPRLFERFYRVDKARSRRMGGTGLGLAIVKHIVQAHDGTVSVTSTPGAGSTFTIRLPGARRPVPAGDAQY